MNRMMAVCAVVLFTISSAVAAGQQRATGTPPARGAAAPLPKPSPGAGPLIVFETANKGSFVMETYPTEAPKTVAHILALVKRNFYNGQRIHRVEPGFVVQWGDPYSRDYTRRDRWGTGGSGQAIGVSEVKRRHRLGSVAAAHPGDGRKADSQIYVSFGPQPQLDRDFTVFGQVIAGMDVVRKLEVGDVIRRATVK